MTSAYFITDSIGGAALPNDFCHIVSARLGWTPTIDQVGGSGFVNGSAFIGRLATLIAAAPNIVVVEGGFNDRLLDIGTVTTAINAFFSALAAGVPAAKVYVCAPWLAPTVTAAAAIAAAIKASATSHGYAYIDWLTKPWLTGTGYVGTLHGDGNSDAYISSDGVHPNLAGAAYLGTRLAFAIKPPATGLEY